MDDERFETDYETLTDEQLNAYYNAVTDDIPDLWDRISFGFEIEKKEIEKKEIEKKEIEKETKTGKNNYNDTNYDNSIIIKEKQRKQVIKRFIPALAAAILVFAICIPVYLHSVSSNKSESNMTIKNINSADKAESKCEDATAASVCESDAYDYEEAVSESTNKQQALNTAVNKAEATEAQGAQINGEDNNTYDEDINDIEKAVVSANGYFVKAEYGVEFKLLVQFTDADDSAELNGKRLIISNTEVISDFMNSGRNISETVKVEFVVNNSDDFDEADVIYITLNKVE